jgi:hypothetical protein
VYLAQYPVHGQYSTNVGRINHQARRGCLIGAKGFHQFMYEVRVGQKKKSIFKNKWMMGSAARQREDGTLLMCH